MFDIQLKKTARLPNVYVESVECTELGRRQQRLGCAIILNKYDSKIIHTYRLFNFDVFEVFRPFFQREEGVKIDELINVAPKQCAWMDR